jgi:hypothetical protein
MERVVVCRDNMKSFVQSISGSFDALLEHLTRGEHCTLACKKPCRPKIGYSCGTHAGVHFVRMATASSV